MLSLELWPAQLRGSVGREMGRQRCAAGPAVAAGL